MWGVLEPLITYTSLRMYNEARKAKNKKIIHWSKTKLFINNK